MAGTLALKTVLNSLYFSGAQAASRFWLSGLGAILMLHHVRDEEPADFSPNGHLTVSPGFLDKLLTRLSARGFEFLSLDDALERIANHDPRDWLDPFVTITLDDGYRDNLENAVPVFRKHEAPYTIYVASGLVDGKADIWWEDLEQIIAMRDGFYLESPQGRIAFETPDANSKNKAFFELLEFLSFSVTETEQRRIVRDLGKQSGYDAQAHRAREIMNWEELASLKSDPLCTIGAHTIHHNALARLDDEDAHRELVEGARILEMELGGWPRHFAFPYGFPAAAGPRDFEMAKKAGFVSAVTTRHGVLYPDHVEHLHALPRISLNGGFQSMRYVETLLSGLPTRINNRGARLNVA